MINRNSICIGCGQRVYRCQCDRVFQVFLVISAIFVGAVIWGSLR